MGCRLRLIFLLPAALGLVVGTSAAAHDIWLTTEPGPEGAVQVLVHHGHPGDRKPPDPDKLFELRRIGPDGRSASLLSGISAGTRDGNPVLVTRPIQPEAPGVLLLTAQYDNGYWVKTESGYRNTGKREFPEADESLYSTKFAKALVSLEQLAPTAYARVLGHRLELVPQDDPFRVPVGGTLHVLVLFEGKPLEGVGVELGDGVTPQKEADIPRYRTNGEGIAEVPIRKPGLQVIVVDHTAPSRHPDLAAKEQMAATLSFVVQ